jgi:2,5-diketo-D-gluconate reductase B
METITTQGVAIPRLGFGTFRMPAADARPVVESAIALGYLRVNGILVRPPFAPEWDAAA